MQLSCPTCHQLLTLPAELPGHLVSCPHCSTVLDVSAAMQPVGAASATSHAGPAAHASPGVSHAPDAVVGLGAAPSRPRAIRKRKAKSNIPGYGLLIGGMLAALVGLFFVVRAINVANAPAPFDKTGDTAFLKARELVFERLDKQVNASISDQKEAVKKLDKSRWHVKGYADEPLKNGDTLRHTWTAEVKRVDDENWELLALEYDGQPFASADPADEEAFDEEVEPFEWVETMQGDSTWSQAGGSYEAQGSEFYQNQTVAWAMEQVQGHLETALGEKPLLVIWLIDQSASSAVHRGGAAGELFNMYEVLEAAATAGEDAGAARLLSVVGGYAKDVTWAVEEPIADVREVESAMRGIAEDASGVENTFAAIRDSIEKYQDQAAERGLIVVVVSDEVGDDEANIEPTLAALKQHEIPLYVVGTRAPLGRFANPGGSGETPVGFAMAGSGPATWRRGPESFMSERIQLSFVGGGYGDDAELIDSGFGPFSLTRLANESGGNYYACRLGGGGGYGGDGLVHFFDPKIMREYAPDYVTADAYKALLGENKARQALVNAARLPRADAFRQASLTFRKLPNEAENKQQLDAAQKGAATIEPKVDAIYQALKAGESDRAKLTGQRWQAGYDLAMGRVLAAKVRTEGFNTMLANMKGGMKFEDPANDVLYLQASETIGAGSAFERMLKDSRKYLERVVKDHPGTPWAYLAQKELSSPCGWQWAEGKSGMMPPAR